jgi:alpha-N-arabinofuranosidase
MAGPALFLRHIDAPAWDNAFINFDHYRWFPAPNYVVMKLWRDNYAPKLLEIKADSNSLNINATLSADKKTLFIKCVNPTDEPVDVSADIEGFFKPSSVSMQLVAPGSLRARNTLDRPDIIKAESANAAINGSNIKFTMPSLSAAVLTVKK